MSAAEGGRRSRLALTILRVAVAILLLIHGAARVRLGGIAPFGAFLESRGIPAGAAVAMLVTAGILLVHLKEGWFVVGAGRNGIEYSILLIAALVAIALGEPRRPRTAEQSG